MKREIKFLWGYLAVCVVLIAISAASGNYQMPLLVALLLVLTPVAVCLVVALSLIPVAVHELGHVVAGKAVGMELVMIQVGPVAWRMTEGRLKAERVGAINLGGLASMRSPRGEFSRSRFGWFILGGPIGSVLMLGIAALGLWAAGGGSLDATNSWLSMIRLLLVAVAIYSASFVLACLVPHQHRGMSSDMRVLLLLLKKGAAADRLAALVQIDGQIQAGVYSKDLDDTLLDTACRVKDGSVQEATANLYHYLCLEERKDIDTARPFLARCREIDIGDNFAVLRRLIRYVGCYRDAKDALVEEAKRSLGTNTEKTPILVPMWARAHAAIALAEGQKDQALAWIDRAIDATTRGRKSLTIVEKHALEWYEKWRAEVSAMASPIDSR